VTSSEDRVRLEGSLRRIEELVSTLDQLADPNTREHARELLETVLDLHGLALSRMVALFARAERGADLLEQLGRDEQVRAVLLLHGLHPEELETRIRRALDAPPLQSRGVHVALVGVSGGVARLRVRRSDGIAAAALGQEIEEAVSEAAPDLEAIEIQFEDGEETKPAQVAAAVA
jgi:hypothetical protein